MPLFHINLTFIFLFDSIVQMWKACQHMTMSMHMEMLAFGSMLESCLTCHKKKIAETTEEKVVKMVGMFCMWKRKLCPEWQYFCRTFCF